MNTADGDPRISLSYADISATTAIPNDSVGLVSICLVLHELPRHATEAVLREAHRILSPGGTLGINTFLIITRFNYP